MSGGVLDRLTNAATEPGMGYNSKTSEWLLPYIGEVTWVVLSFTGVVAFILFIYAGWLWMSARGNEEQITKAKNLIKGVIMGLALVLLAGVIAYLIFFYLLSNTTIIY